MPFGTTPDGRAVELYTLSNGRITARVIPFGGIITELLAPDRRGDVADVVLGFDDLSGYLQRHPYFGAIIGRVANRVAQGHFSIDGRAYQLALNNGPNTLHGGIVGFDRLVWDVESVDATSICLSLVSPDGDEGFPGNLSVRVTYSLWPDDALRIDYQATTDAATPINLTNHSYFNLAGPASGPILGHEVEIASDRYTPVDDTLIPTGEILPVDGTPLDFRKPHPVGERIDAIGGDPGGYDHNYVLRGGPATPALAARVYEPTTGRVLEAFTTEPGIQFYSGNFLDGSFTGKGGVVYRKHGGFCLEAQHFPDSMNHPTFPNTILRPGETYRQTTVYRFSTR